MDNQERHYNINKLNILFALSSVLLLLSIGVMVQDDYERKWKDYQEQFRAWEIEKTRVKYDSAINELKAQEEYARLEDELAKARKNYQATCINKELSQSVKKLDNDIELFSQQYRVKKAELDAAKFAYEEALGRHKTEVKYTKAVYDKLNGEVNHLNKKIEEKQEAKDDKLKIQDDCAKELKELEKKKKTLAAKASIIERKLSKIDPSQMGLTNQIAGIVRDMPILDLANPSNKIQQIVLKDITDDVNFMKVPKVDRCITCHLGISDPDYKDAPQPFTSHPNLELFVSKNSAHPLEEFGCTACHGGRGRGTDFNSAAHTPSSEEQKAEWEEKYHWHKFHHWEDPMLPSQYVQAGCFKCHSNQTEIRGAEKLNLGLQLVERAGCYSCHTIQKYKDKLKPGPDLTHVASKISKEWAYRWITDPKAFRHSTWMPSFFGQDNNNDEKSVKRSQQEIHSMIHYLFSVSKPFELTEMKSWGNPKKGEELVKSIGCFGCHMIDKGPERESSTKHSLLRQQGPNLIGLGTKTSKAWIYNWLKDPQKYHAKTKMPSLRLTDEEAADITAYLTQDKNEAFNSKPILAVNETIINTITHDFLKKNMMRTQVNNKMASMTLSDKLRFNGEKLIAHYGCFSCHDIPGFEDYKPIGTELTEEGSKAVDKLDFGFIDIEHINYAWFRQKLKDPRIFDRGRVRAPDEKLRMPNFYFTDEEIDAIVTALLSFVENKPDESKMFPRTTRNLQIEQGQKIVREFNCQGCHIIEGQGGAIQPQVAEWLVAYDNRSEGEADAIKGIFSPPDLIGEGKKVRSEWLFNFLHGPTTIRPWLKARMPTYSFDTAQLNALITYFNALDNQDFPFSDIIDEDFDKAQIQAGEKLFSNDYFGCASCHIVGDKLPAGSPDSWAPDFSLVKERLKPEWIVEWLKNPQDLLPGTKMPTYFDPEYFNESGPEDILNGDEYAQIIALRNYLLTLSSTDDIKRAQTPSAMPQTETAMPPTSQTETFETESPATP